MLKRVLITQRLPERVIDAARDRFDVTTRAAQGGLSADELRWALRDFDAVLPTLGDMFTAEVFDDVPKPRARMLANFGVGYNHIDVAAAGRAGIVVSNTPGAVTDATADIAMTLILMSCRRAAEGERLVRSGRWQGWTPVQMLGLHVTGRTLGIVGMGRIGQAIARRCHFGFGMSIGFVNRSARTLEFPATRFNTIQDLAAEVDILVIATPGGDETRHLVDASVFAAMKPTAHFVNISRGEVVDEAALVLALENGAIAGAGLDVYEHEPHVPDALRALDNVTLLPHLGTATLEVRENMGMMAVDNLQAFFDGKPPPNRL